MVYISDYTCTCMCLYTIMICTDGTTINICQCVLLDSSCITEQMFIPLWCASVVCPCKWYIDTDVLVSMFM